ncbi:hypothetical protein Salat_1680700 [Sesamum alatum]|uniref:Uncharacterized protein n=1 Tax=Sesamum alatum TaxID=300844 RepID=A0AAE1Y702_9LAMI|nr:hypothetical protein Salat_1680700 [Sesamum alatum]
MDGGGIGGWVVHLPVNRRLTRSGGFFSDPTKATTKMGTTWIEASVLTRRVNWHWWRQAACGRTLEDQSNNKQHGWADWLDAKKMVGHVVGDITECVSGDRAATAASVVELEPLILLLPSILLRQFQ